MELDTEVLILTGYATMESATEALNYGARGYIMKPIEKVPEFRNKVGEAVRVARLARINKQFYDAIVSGKADSLLIDGKVYQVPVLREENIEMFQRLMEVIHDAVIFLDFDGNITFANVNFARMVGEAYHKLLGARFESYVVEEDQDKVIEGFTRLSSGQIAVSIPVQLKTNFGSSLSVIISASPIHYEMEYRGIVMVISDVTEINTVRRKVELLANLVENAQYDMIFIVEPDGQIMECNSLARSSLSYSQSKMLSLNIRALFKFRVDVEWEKIMDSVEQFSHWQGELMAISKGGTEFPVEITFSKPGREVGHSANMICFARDITERKRAAETESEARAMTEKVEQLERELSSLEQISHGSATTVTARSFGLKSFRQISPDSFNQLVLQYGDLVELALEQRAYRVEHDISGKLRTIAEQLRFYNAGPRDVIEIHSLALRSKTNEVSHVKAQAYIEEGRTMVLELMGYLAICYRTYSYDSQHNVK